MRVGSRLRHEMRVAIGACSAFLWIDANLAVWGCGYGVTQLPMQSVVQLPLQSVAQLPLRLEVGLHLRLRFGLDTFSAKS